MDRAREAQLIDLCVKLDAYQTAVVLRAVFGWRYVDPNEPLMEALKNPSDETPAAGRTCIITAGGEVLTHWVTPNGEWSIVNLGSVENFRDGMRRLADTAKLPDDQRVAFFEELRKWVKDDYRPEAATDWLGAAKALDHS